MTTALDAASAEPTAAAIEAVARLRRGTVAPATWNRHAATVRSFLGHAARNRLLPELRVELDRRREPAERTRALPRAALDRLWNRRDIPLRDTTLSRLLYETAARASEALALNVEDRDLPNRRAAIRGKNGELDYLHWQTGTGHLLSRLIAAPRGRCSLRTVERTRAGRPPGRTFARTLAAPDFPTAAPRSFSPRRPAAELCTSSVTPRSPTSPRPTSRCPLLMAKSRHTSLRSLQKYARPGGRRRRQTHRRPRPRTATA